MAHITLFAQPNKDEPFIVLSRDIEPSYTIVQNLQGSKCLTDMGASLFDSIRTLDNGVKVRGEDLGNERYLWKMTFYGAGCEVVATPVRFKAQEPACMGYALQITATGSSAAMSNVFQTLLLNIKRNPFDITDWDAFTNKTGVSRDTVVNTWNNAMFPIEESQQVQESVPEGKAAPEAKDSENEIHKRIQGIESIRKRKVVEESSREGDIKKLVSLGIECFNNGDFETAIFHWQKIMEIEPQHQDTLKAIEVARNKIKERRSKIEASQMDQLKGDTLRHVEERLRSSIEAEVTERL